MYTIREAAARAGIPVSTLRAWERRYGIVRPSRSAAAYRLYALEELETLRRMRRLVDRGWTPSVAAAALLRGDPAATAAAEEERSPSGGDGEAGDGVLLAATDRSERDTGSTAARTLIDRFTTAAIALDQEAVGAALDEMLSRGSFERVASQLVLPALRSLGDAWADGRLSVAGEHAASHAVLRRLAAAFEAAGSPPQGVADVVVAMPPDGRHEFGALAFAIAARRAGLAVAYLGADLPADDWLAATEGARAAVIGAPTIADAEGATAIARRLRRKRPDLVVAIGGSAAPSLGGALRLPDDLNEAVAALAEALAAKA